MSSIKDNIPASPWFLSKREYDVARYSRGLLIVHTEEEEILTKICERGDVGSVTQKQMSIMKCVRAIPEMLDILERLAKCDVKNDEEAVSEYYALNFQAINLLKQLNQ